MTAEEECDIYRKFLAKLYNSRISGNQIECIDRIEAYGAVIDCDIVVDDVKSEVLHKLNK